MWQPRTADELRNLTALAQAAVGFDSTRGDALTVQDLAFDGNRSLQPGSLPRQVLAAAENSPVLVKYAALFMGVCVVLAFGVRPALSHARIGPAQPVRSVPKELAGHEVAPLSPSLKPPEPVELDHERARSQEIFERVTEHLKREPTQSSRLLRSWIHSN